MPPRDLAEKTAPPRISRRIPEGKAAWDKGRTRELFRRFKQGGDEEAREQLIVSHLNLVRFLASKFKNRGESLEDLVQVGTIGLIKAIDRFDPERGLEFTTYATPYDHGRDQAPLPRQGLVGARAAPPAGALRQGQPDQRRAHQPAAEKPLGGRDRRAPRRER
jgi:hypothetical protein